jgi:hypothetical protein
MHGEIIYFLGGSCESDGLFFFLFETGMGKKGWRGADMDAAAGYFFFCPSVRV